MPRAPLAEDRPRPHLAPDIIDGATTGQGA
jgi:hypothetical protein